MKALIAFWPLCLALVISSPGLAKTGMDLDFSLDWVHSPTRDVTTSFAEQLLVKVISEPEDNIVHELNLATAEDGKIERIYRTSPDGHHEISPDELLHGEVVLASAEGRDALLMSCIDCSLQTGGRIVLRYLVNGIWMNYKKFNMDLKVENGAWQLYTSEGNSPANTLRLISNHVFGKLVGIAEIKVEN